MTSHDVVSFIRRQYGIKRVGHAGTLDPAAAGVLPIFVGNATRLVEYLADSDKSYRAEVLFGFTTDTGDDTGRVVDKRPYLRPELSRIKEVLTSFIGISQQVPPMYSAIKVDGKKLYELARSGQTVERQPRTIEISDISLVKERENGILFDVTCSKGTYVRTLCADIGSKLDCLAVMSFLVRTRVGGFSLENALTLEEIAVNKEQAIQRPDIALNHFPAKYLSESESVAVRNGRSISCEKSGAVLHRIYDCRNILVGIGREVDQSESHTVLQPVKILSPND